MNRTEKIMKVLGWIDEGYILKAVKSFSNDLDDESREFIFSLLGELRRKIKQQSKRKEAYATLYDTKLQEQIRGMELEFKVKAPEGVNVSEILERATALFAWAQKDPDQFGLPLEDPSGAGEPPGDGK